MRLLSALLLLAAVGCHPVNIPVPDNDDTPAPVVVPNVVDASEVTRILKSHPSEARLLERFYADLADLVQRDTEIVRSTADVRKAHETAGRLLGQATSLQANTQGLGKVVDGLIEEALGLEAVPLSDELRRKAVGVFTQISQACGEAT